MRLGRISVTFVRQALMAPVLTNLPVMTGADQSLTPITRIMHALGSLNNQADFNLLLNRLNNLKSRVFDHLQFFFSGDDQVTYHFFSLALAFKNTYR